MAFSEEKFCPLCAKRAEQSKLILYKINDTDGIYLCSKRECVYPNEVMPLEEAIVKYPKKSSCSPLIMRSKASPSSPSTTTNNFNLLRSDSCERQPRTPIRPLSNSSPDPSTYSPPADNISSQKGPSNSQAVIRRNCTYTTCRSFPYYIPVPSSVKLNAKPKKFQSFMTSVEQEQNVLSPSGSEGSSRDSGFNSHTSSPVPPVASTDIDQFLDEIANLDDIN